MILKYIHSEIQAKFSLLFREQSVWATVSLKEVSVEGSWTWGVNHTSLIRNSSKYSNFCTRSYGFRQSGIVSHKTFFFRVGYRYTVTVYYWHRHMFGIFQKKRQQKEVMLILAKKCGERFLFIYLIIHYYLFSVQNTVLYLK